MGSGTPGPRRVDGARTEQGRRQAENRGDLCSEVSATWGWVATTGPRQGAVRTLADDDPHPQVPRMRVHYRRCGGPVYRVQRGPLRGVTHGAGAPRGRAPGSENAADGAFAPR